MRYVIQYANGNYARETGNSKWNADLKKATKIGGALDGARIFGNIANAKSSRAWEEGAKVVEVKLVVPTEINAVMIVELNIDVADGDVYDRVAQAAGIDRSAAKVLVLGELYSGKKASPEATAAILDSIVDGPNA